MYGWVKPNICINRTWLKPKVIHTIAKNVSEVIYCTDNSIKSSNNNILLSLMFRSKFWTTSGPILLRWRWCEVSILDIIWHNINPIESGIGEVYAENLTGYNSCIEAIIRFGRMESCINILGFPSEAHLHIKNHMTRHIAIHWQRLFFSF